MQPLPIAVFNIRTHVTKENIMKISNKVLLAMTLCFTLVQLPAHAEDIDIYGSPVNEFDKPNILIIIDNSANWDAANQHWPSIKQGQAELRALSNVVNELSDNVRVGLMMFTPGAGTAYDGGYIRYRVRTMNDVNKAALRELLGSPSCTPGPNSLNGTPNCIFDNFAAPSEKVGTAKTDYSAAMYEAFKYFGGYTNPAHANDDPVTVATAGSPTGPTGYGPMRYGGNPEVNTDLCAFADYPGTGACSSAAKSTWRTPSQGSTGCAKNYIIFIGNGFPVKDSASSLLSNVGGNTSTIAVPTYTTTTTVTTTAAGNTEACYASAAAATAATTDRPSICSTLSSPDNCSVGASIPNTTATACPSGTQSYPVIGTTSALPAATVTINISGSVLGTTSGSTGNWAITTATPPAFTTANSVTIAGCASDTAGRSLNGTFTPTSVSASGFHITTDKSAPACTAGTVSYNRAAISASTTALGYSRCASACTTADYSSQCSSFTGGCSCTIPTINTSPACATGTNKYTINSNLSVNTVTASTTTSLPSWSNYADEWARFLYNTDVNSSAGQQNIRTYTIDVYKDAQDANETALLRSMAESGRGKYFAATDEAAILNALRKIFSEIQSVNSVFASSSLPVSVNTQGTYLNQVFIGMFRPDSSGAPRWLGNLKQYEFAFFGNLLKLADKNKNEAISVTTGFITPCAESFWSTDSGPYWDFSGSSGKGSCAAVTSAFPTAGSSSMYSDLPDGELVEKGGAGQHLRGVGSTAGVLTSSSTFYATGSRHLQTCDNAACTSLIDFSTANATVTGLVSSNLIDWVRGKDTHDENGNSILTEMRPSSHGDVVHSQPAAVDYGGTNGVYVFYGTNDGIFHAIRGDKVDADGDERWGFIAPETYGRLPRLENNTPNVNIPGTSSPKAAKDYFFDGSVAAYQNGSTVWVYASMRRGGRSIYAFDMSTPTTPTLKWRKGCFTNSTTDDTNCSTGWSSIGQTWSKPQFGKLSGFTGKVMVFGGGYDTCEDTDSQTRCTTTPRKGANIWFVNADTGAIIRSYPANYSVPGDVKLVTDSNGNITQVYAADTGGYVYRINVGTYDGTTVAGWVSNSAASNITIANLSETNNARKFMNGLDVVETATYNAVTLGSGDREHPLVGNYPCGTYSTSAGNYVKNQFYMIKDTPPGYPASPITVSGVSTGLTDISNTPTATVGNINPRGWVFDLLQCEQTVNKPVTIGGVTYFGTNQPTNTTVAACTSNLGTARGYAINVLTGGYGSGSSRSTIYTGGGLPPSPVAGVVEVDGVKVPFILGAGSESALGGGKVVINPSGNRARTYRFIQGK